MNLRITHDSSNVNWNLVPDILKEVGMGYFDAEIHKRAFNNSYSVVFVYDEDKLVGFGRALSDGAYQAGIYDVAVIPEYQGKGIGKMIIENIIESIPQCNFILYAAIGKERFYESLGFKKMKTGMALFKNAELMQLKGFTE